MSNWHDAMRLALLRCLGVHNRDLRRLLISWCEAAQFEVVQGLWIADTFHEVCRKRAKSSGKFTVPAVFHDKQNVEQFEYFREPSIEAFRLKNSHLFK